MDRPGWADKDRLGAFASKPAKNLTLVATFVSRPSLYHTVRPVHRSRVICAPPLSPLLLSNHNLSPRSLIVSETRSHSSANPSACPRTSIAHQSSPSPISTMTLSTYHQCVDGWHPPSGAAAARVSHPIHLYSFDHLYLTSSRMPQCLGRGSCRMSANPLWCGQD